MEVLFVLKVFFTKTDRFRTWIFAPETIAGGMSKPSMKRKDDMETRKRERWKELKNF